MFSGDREAFGFAWLRDASCEVIFLAPEATRDGRPVEWPCPTADRPAGGHSGEHTVPDCADTAGATVGLEIQEYASVAPAQWEHPRQRAVLDQ